MMKLSKALTRYSKEYLAIMCKSYQIDMTNMSVEQMISALVPRILDPEHLIFHLAQMKEQALHDYIKLSQSSKPSKRSKIPGELKRFYINVIQRNVKRLCYAIQGIQGGQLKLEKYEYLSTWEYLSGLYIHITPHTDIICEEIAAFIGMRETQETISQLRDGILLRHNFFDRLIELYGTISLSNAEKLFERHCEEPLFNDKTTLDMLAASANFGYDHTGNRESFPLWYIDKNRGFLINHMIDQPDSLIAAQNNVPFCLFEKGDPLFDRTRLTLNINDAYSPRIEALVKLEQFYRQYYPNSTDEQIQDIIAVNLCAMTICSEQLTEQEFVDSLYEDTIYHFGQAVEPLILQSIARDIYGQFPCWMLNGYSPDERRAMLA